MRGIIACFLIVGSTPAGAEEPFSHVRSEQAAVRSWLAEGYERSATFRALVDEIDRRPGIVYIEATNNVPHQLDGALVHNISGSRELPMLRVIVRASLDRVDGITTLAHEMQHVVEVLRAGKTTDGAAMSELFAAINGTHRNGSTLYETAEARSIAQRVRGELSRTRRRIGGEDDH